MKEAEIRAELTSRGIEFKDDATPEQLLNILNESLGEGEDLRELDAGKKGKKGKLKPDTQVKEKIDPPLRVPDAFQPSAPKRGSVVPGDRGGEYVSIKLENGMSEEITMTNNVRHDGERFLQGKKYVVKIQLAKLFREEQWVA